MFLESGPAQVLHSGIVTTFGGNPLQMIVPLPGDTLAVQWHFEQDREVHGAAFDCQATDTGYRIVCTNIEDAAGRGSSDPVLLGELGPDLFFVHFRVFRFGDTPDCTLHYTFFRADKETVGWTPTR